MPAFFHHILGLVVGLSPPRWSPLVFRFGVHAHFGIVGIIIIIICVCVCSLYKTIYSSAPLGSIVVVVRTIKMGGLLAFTFKWKLMLHVIVNQPMQYYVHRHTLLVFHAHSYAILCTLHSVVMLYDIYRYTCGILNYVVTI